LIRIWGYHSPHNLRVRHMKPNDSKNLSLLAPDNLFSFHALRTSHPSSMPAPLIARRHYLMSLSRIQIR